MTRKFSTSDEKSKEEISKFSTTSGSTSLENSLCLKLSLSPSTTENFSNSGDLSLLTKEDGNKLCKQEHKLKNGNQNLHHFFRQYQNSSSTPLFYQHGMAVVKRFDRSTPTMIKLCFKLGRKSSME